MKVPSNKSNKLALIYGILLGDGSLSKLSNKYYFISIVGNINDDLKFFEEIITPILKSFTGKEIKIRKRIKQRKIEVLFSNKDFLNLMNKLGFPIGKKGVKLRIPDSFQEAHLKYLIQGYFATDGCLVLTNNNGILYPRLEFSSISKTLLMDVLGYLTKVGMKGNIYISHKYNNHWNTLYRIQFNGKNNLKTFINKIGFVNSKHESKLEFYKKNGEKGI